MSNKTSEAPVPESLRHILEQLSYESVEAQYLDPATDVHDIGYVFEAVNRAEKAIADVLPKPQPVSGDMESLRTEIAKAMKFWRASDGTWWSASRRVCVDKRLDKLVAIHQQYLTQFKERAEKDAADKIRSVITAHKGLNSDSEVLALVEASLDVIGQIEAAEAIRKI